MRESDISPDSKNALALPLDRGKRVIQRELARLRARRLSTEGDALPRGAHQDTTLELSRDHETSKSPDPQDGSSTPPCRQRCGPASPCRYCARSRAAWSELSTFTRVKPRVMVDNRQCNGCNRTADRLNPLPTLPYCGTVGCAEAPEIVPEGPAYRC